MYNKEQFLNDFKGSRIRNIITFCNDREEFFPFDELFNLVNEKAKQHYIKKGIKNSQGHPSETKGDIIYFIKMGYLIADPKKGLKRNPNFIPRNQK